MPRASPKEKVKDQYTVLQFCTKNRGSPNEMHEESFFYIFD